MCNPWIGLVHFGEVDQHGLHQQGNAGVATEKPSKQRKKTHTDRKKHQKKPILYVDHEK
jgi:hypothetical protein